MWWRRRGGQTLTITLRLKTIDHLFETPGMSPFDPYFAPYSFGPGIDYVVEEMERAPDARETELIILLPEEQFAGTPDLPARTSEAIDRYAAAWIAAATRSRAVERRQVRTVGGSAIIFFAVANLLSIAYAREGSLFEMSGPLLDVLLDGLSVGAWVALWWPFDLLFQGWQRRLELRVYRALPSVSLRILADRDSLRPG